MMLREIEDGAFFFEGNDAYVKSVYGNVPGIRQHSADFPEVRVFRCHPVSAGQFGNIIHDKIDCWLRGDTRVRLMPPKEHV